MKPRIWMLNPTIPAASQYLRSKLVQAVAARRWSDAWPFLAILFGLDESDRPLRPVRAILEDMRDTTGLPPETQAVGTSFRRGDARVSPKCW
jgi:hypothetical protein